MSLNGLDLLPVELIHKIFSYLSAHEIFYAFLNLSDYVNATLISYNRYIVNFRSVLKCHFDVTCQSIRPDRIISLTLSDDDETLDQSKLFFSYFKIEEFVHLRSFDMSSMNNDTWKSLSGLHQLKELSSVELPRLFEPFSTDFEVVIGKVLPQLNRLMVYNTYHLLEKTLPNLHRLSLKYCGCYQLRTVFEMIPNLQSLDIILTLDTRSNWWDIPLLTHLRILKLQSYGERLIMLQMKEFLSKIPNLKHFELDTEGSRDLIDGQQWESVVANLVRFDFRIRLLEPLLYVDKENVLQSFRSLFWLEQKH
jgi:hypothetical protein